MQINPTVIYFPIWLNNKEVGDSRACSLLLEMQTMATVVKNSMKHPQNSKIKPMWEFLTTAYI